MPYRHIPCETGMCYHVFNRSVAKEAIFRSHRDLERFYNLFQFYRFSKPSCRYSEYQRLPVEAQTLFLKRLTTSHPVVDILAFAVMPDHFHFVLKQLTDSGITAFLSLIQNGYAKYFNTKYHRHGAAFQAMYKEILLETDEQLLHTVRYVHLNPVTANICQTVEHLSTYPWTSYTDYAGGRKNSSISTLPVLAHFRKAESFESFMINQVEYQKTLAFIKEFD